MKFSRKLLWYYFSSFQSVQKNQRAGDIQIELPSEWSSSHVTSFTNWVMRLGISSRCLLVLRGSESSSRDAREASDSSLARRFSSPRFSSFRPNHFSRHFFPPVSPTDSSRLVSHSPVLYTSVSKRGVLALHFMHFIFHFDRSPRDSPTGPRGPLGRIVEDDARGAAPALSSIWRQMFRFASFFFLRRRAKAAPGRPVGSGGARSEAGPRSA